MGYATTLFSGLVFVVLTMGSAISRAKNFDALDCVIEPHKLVELSSQVQGVLEKVTVERGDFVKKGQLVAKLKSGVEDASVSLARSRAKMDVDIHSRKAELEFRESTFGRVERLFHKNLASQREFEDAKTQSVIADFEYKKAIELKHLAGLELRRAQEIAKLRLIKSSVSGVVIDVIKLPGEYVEEQPVVKIGQIDPLNVEAIVPEDRFGTINVGMEAKVAVSQPRVADHIAKVTIVDPIIDASSGTFGVRMELPNPEYKIPAGLRCKVVFIDKSELRTQ